MKKMVYPAAALMLAVMAAPSHAVTILNLTGTGNVCTYASNGSCASDYYGAFTGVVTREVVGAPGGTDFYTNGSTYAFDSNGWVHSTYQFTWDTGSYTYTDVALADYTYDSAQVRNNNGSFDQLSTHRESIRNVSTADGYTDHVSYAILFSDTPDLDWIDSLDFPEGHGLSGYSDFSNFMDYGYTYSYSTGARDFYGLSGYITWTSAVVTTSVPEPGTLALLSLGLLGAGMAIRRRRPVR